MFCLSGGEFDAFEAFEFMRGTVDFWGVFCDVELGYFSAFALAGISDVEGGDHLERLTGVYLQKFQVGELEGRVGEAVAEGEEGLGVVLFVSAVADVDAFFVFDFAGVAFGVVVGEGGVVFGAALKGGGKVAGGVGFAEEDFCEGFAALLSAVPGFEEDRDVVEPALRIDVAAGGDGDDGFGVGGGDFADEFVLAEGEGEGAVAGFAFAVLRDSRPR